MKNWIARLARLMIILLFIATFIGLVAADKWWIQGFDFPRLQFAILLVIALILLFSAKSKHLWAYAAAGIAALAFQLYQVVPYFGVAPEQAAAADSCAVDSQFTVLNLNVLQTNRDYDRTLALVADVDPDIFLAMETDGGWVEALDTLRAGYPHGEAVALDNKYGMAIYSRVPLSEFERQAMAGGETPAFRMRVELADGSRPTLFTVHPQPPHPGQSSGQRDAELIMLSDLVRESGRPTLVMGDFNDVPWSSVTESFQRVGQLVDARRGRGFMATFDATNPMMRWPLDHLFFTDDFGVMQFETGPDVGSDHYPLIATLCQNGERFDAEQDVPELDQGAREEAVEQLRQADEVDAEETADDLTTPG
ncbi:MAG: endonuclease/exonuclease/phosphatase family protein [Pacificimonas sp.]